MVKRTYISSLRRNAEILTDFIGRMEAGEIERRIGDFWTIRQHLEHLVESQKVLLRRMELFVTEESPVIRPYTPDGSAAADEPSVKALLAEFESLRDRQIALISKAGRRVWEKAGEHPEFKKYDFDILVRHAILHDGFHMWRMEELWIKKDELILALESN